MLSLRKVAITGGLSSGKTSVCRLLKERGAYFVSADEIVHQLLSPQSKISQEIEKLLGEEVVTGGLLDRVKIAKKVFSDRETLKALEHLLHPAVLKEIERQYNQVKNQEQYTLFVAEVPLLYESESEHLFDTVVAVMVDSQIAEERYQKKTKHSIEEFEMRMAQQLPPEQKAANANFTIFNSGDFADLEKQVETLYQQLIRSN